MRNFSFAVAALALFAAGLSFSGPAFAGDRAADQSAAIALCKTETAERAGVAEGDVRLDRVVLRASRVRVDLDVWVNGELANVRCDVERGSALSIVALNLPETPAQTASAQ